MKPYYSDKYVQIFHGDCRDILPSLEPVDLVLTDPPYGIDMASGFSGCVGFKGKGSPIERRQYPDTWDKLRPDEDTIKLILHTGKEAIVFGGNHMADILPVSSHWIVWDKLNTMPSFGDCELLWTNIDRKSVKRYIVEWNGLIGKEETRYHPTQKPVKLISLLIADYSKENALILDPFLGSGTTAYCAKKLQRRCIGIEIEEKYCEIAARRCQQEVMVLDIPAQPIEKQPELL